MNRSTFMVLFYVNDRKEKDGIIPIMGRVTINETANNQALPAHIRREAFVIAEMVRNAYQGTGSEHETLIKAFDKDHANFLRRVGKDRTIGTYKAMVRARNYVAAFIEALYKRNDMSMLKLTSDFIKEFAAYLTTERNLKNATI